jgi:hypothetical protein
MTRKHEAPFRALEVKDRRIAELEAEVERLRGLIIRAGDEIADQDYEFGYCNGCGQEVANDEPHKPDCILVALAQEVK